MKFEQGLDHLSLDKIDLNVLYRALRSKLIKNPPTFRKGQQQAGADLRDSKYTAREFNWQKAQTALGKHNTKKF